MVFLSVASLNVYPKLSKGWTVIWQCQPNKPAHFLRWFWLEYLITARSKQTRTKCAMPSVSVSTKGLKLLITFGGVLKIIGLLETNAIESYTDLTWLFL